MYTYHVVLVGMPLNGNHCGEGFLPCLFDKLDEIVDDDIISIDDLMDILDEENITLEDTEFDFMKWMSDNSRHLEIRSYYHGSSDASPMSLEFKPNETEIPIHQDDLYNYTWTPDRMHKYLREIKAFDTFCKQSMPPELYDVVKSSIGLSFINVST